jgi:3-deoxy-D-manno-octulosonic-acid transferase
LHPLLRAAYGVGGVLARGAALVAPDGEGKLLRTLRARRGIRARYAAWGETHRDPSRPLLWMHAPSVGEGLQARPVLELARRERPDLQLAYTYFSPSAERFAASLDVDFADYLPFDTGGDAAAALAALRPRALVFSKLDVWPVLVEAAAHAGVRTALVSATLSAGSSRRGMASAALRPSYAQLDAVGAISDEDAERLVALGVRRDRVRVTGDTRYDQVWRRAAAADRTSALLAPLASDRFTMVAGSTWPADEAVLLDAWQTVRRHEPRARLVIAPHEPTAAHLEPIDRWAAAARCSTVRLGELTGADAGARARAADVVIVDRVGVLGELYAVADIAFVGGGFHDAGLHSVLEPAAFGVPVVFGPKHTNSRDAGILLAAGGASAVTSPRTLAEIVRRWMTSDALRENSGAHARAVVERGLGADVRAWELVAGLL